MKRRNKSRPPVEATYWKREGDLYYADRADIERAIVESGKSTDELKRRLGAGYAELLAVMDGKRVSGWTASHIEWGLEKEHPPAGKHSTLEMGGKA